LSNNFVAPRFFAQAIPPYTEGMRVGLLGGSFNPPHQAHRAISQFALKRLQLDRVWWLVTPGNPLKENGKLHELGARMQAARDVASDSRIEVSCLESVIRTRYTIDTINTLRRRLSACALSGSWAPITSLNSTVGSTGGASPTRCRLRSSIARRRVFVPSPRPPLRRLRAIACPRVRRHCLRIGRRRPGSS
jgi:hypothetical protein